MSDKIEVGYYVAHEDQPLDPDGVTARIGFVFKVAGDRAWVQWSATNTQICDVAKLWRIKPATPEQIKAAGREQ